MYRYRQRYRLIEAFWKKYAFGWALKEGQVVIDGVAIRIKKIR